MSPSPILPAAAQRSRSLRLLGGSVAGTLATLVLLSGCGATPAPSSDDQDPAATPAVAAAEPETAEENGADEPRTDSEDSEDAEPASSTAEEPASPRRRTLPRRRPRSRSRNPSSRSPSPAPAPRW